MARKGESKYDGLGEYLRGLKVDQVRLTFAEIERITGQSLTMSQRNYDAAWSNSRSGGSVIHNQWLDNGWRVASKNLGAEWVLFERTGGPVRAAEAVTLSTHAAKAAESARAADLARVAVRCLMTLDLGSVIAVAPEYGYPNPVLCAIDAVWSLGVRYEAVRGAVASYVSWAAAQGEAPMSEQHTPAVAVRLLSAMSPDEMAETVFCNRHRTSTRNGVLKAEAVMAYLSVLAKADVQTKDDVGLKKDALEPHLRQVKGQSRGASTEYFFMLCGSEDLVKPDRMIQRFVSDAVGRSVTPEAAAGVVVHAAGVLSDWIPGLTPRSLDRAIWAYQRNQGDE